jgi:hypothetical protein
MKGFHISRISEPSAKKQTLRDAEPEIIVDTLRSVPDNNLVTAGKKEDFASAPILVQKKAAIKTRPKQKKIIPLKIPEPKNKVLVQERSKKENELSWGVLALAAGLMGGSFAGAYRFRHSGLLKLQAWSHKNKFKARAIIILTRIALTITGFAAGINLFEAGYILPQYSKFVFACMFLVGILTYPFKKTNRDKISGIFRSRIQGLLMSLGGLFLCISLGNNVAHENSQGINTDHHINKRSSDYFESKKDAPALLSYEDDENDTASYVLRSILLVLTFVSVIVIQFLLIVLSCSLACDGAEGTAATILFGGTILLAFLTVISIYWIKRINLKDPETSS